MKDRSTVEKMIFYADKILKYTENETVKSVSENSVLAEACVFNLSQIGELAHKVSRKFSDKYTQIPWRTLYGLRNKIVHEYDGLRLTLIWEIIFEDIPPLKKELEKILIIAKND